MAAELCGGAVLCVGITTCLCPLGVGIAASCFGGGNEAIDKEHEQWMNYEGPALRPLMLTVPHGGTGSDSDHPCTPSPQLSYRPPSRTVSMMRDGEILGSSNGSPSSTRTSCSNAVGSGGNGTGGSDESEHAA
eukprot:SM000003S11156  [mRNA]  locus=s3:1202861:1203775:- [translate_table: standard]